LRTPTRTFRPQLVLLEDRTTPTVVTGPLQTPNQAVETINIAEVTAFAEVPAVPTLTANFKNVFGAQTNRVDVKLVAGSVSTTFSVNIAGAASPEQIRDTIFGSIPAAVMNKNGWAVQKGGTATEPTITISGYYDAAGIFIKLKEASFTPNRGPRVIITSTSGITVGQASTGGNWSIGLSGSPVDGSQIVPTSGVYTLTLNNTNSVSVAFNTGDSIQLIQQNLYFALLGAGVSDVSLTGSGVEFLTFQGNEITQLQDSFVLDQGYNPGNWVAFTVGVAQRNVIL
jgi:hypothetical protein